MKKQKVKKGITWGDLGRFGSSNEKENLLPESKQGSIFSTFLEAMLDFLRPKKPFHLLEEELLGGLSEKSGSSSLTRSSSLNVLCIWVLVSLKGKSLPLKNNSSALLTILKLETPENSKSVEAGGNSDLEMKLLCCELWDSTKSFENEILGLIGGGEGDDGDWVLLYISKHAIEIMERELNLCTETREE